MDEDGIETGAGAAELVPDVILHLVERNGFLTDPEALIRLRLLNKTWNYSLRHFVGSESLVTNLSEENMSSFSQFLSSDASLKLQESNIRSINLSLRSQLESVYKKALDDFVQLPKFFRSNLRRFKLNSELKFPPDFRLFWNFLRNAQLENLEELEMVVEMTDFYVPVFASLQRNESFHGLRFELLQKLTVPLHLSLHLLKTCSDLKHLSLQVFDVGLPSDFWESFRDIMRLNGLSQSLDELFFEDRRGIHWESESELSFCFVRLFKCNFRLKKLGFGLHFDCEPNDNLKEEFLKFLTQQAETLTFLRLPSLASVVAYCYAHGGYSDTFISDVAHFPNLKELKFEQFNETSGKLFARCPVLEKVVLPNVFRSSSASYVYHRGSLSIKSVIVQDMDRDLSASLGSIFPNMDSLEVLGTISIYRVLKSYLNLTRLKRLSIKVDFKFCDERYLPSMLGKGPCTGEEESDVDLERRVAADCFILGVVPNECKTYHSGRLPCKDDDKFELPDHSCIGKLTRLEYLSLEGYFTEKTIWTGIRPLTQLKEFHLKTEHDIHPRTMFVLESHLSQLRSWSYTKLVQREDGYEEVYKYFRFRTYLKAVGPDQLHVWKFNDDKIEKKVVTLEEFETLDLTNRNTGCPVS